MTEKEAIKLCESKFWENMSYLEIAEFQLNEELLCMPFNIFYEALEKTIGRPIQTLELAYGRDKFLNQIKKLKRNNK